MVPDWMDALLRRCHLLHAWQEYERAHFPRLADAADRSIQGSGTVWTQTVEVRRKCARCGRDALLRLRQDAWQQIEADGARWTISDSRLFPATEKGDICTIGGRSNAILKRLEAAGAQARERGV
jgi:hypothetical protein